MAELDHTEELDPNQFPDQTITIVVKHKGKVFAKGMQLFLGSGAEVEQGLMNLEHITKLVYNRILYKLARDVAPLRLDQIQKMDPGKIFAAGTLLDSDDDTNVKGSGNELRWAAIRGEKNSWNVRIGSLEWSIEDVIREGENLPRDLVRNIIPCTDEALAEYVA